MQKDAQRNGTFCMLLMLNFLCAYGTNVMSYVLTQYTTALHLQTIGMELTSLIDLAIAS